MCQPEVRNSCLKIKRIESVYIKKTWLIFSRVSDVLCFALFTTATLTFEIDEKTIISAVAEDDIIGKTHALKIESMLCKRCHSYIGVIFDLSLRTEMSQLYTTTLSGGEIRDFIYYSSDWTFPSWCFCLPLYFVFLWPPLT